MEKQIALSYKACGLCLGGDRLHMWLHIVDEEGNCLKFEVFHPEVLQYTNKYPTSVN